MITEKITEGTPKINPLAGEINAVSIFLAFLFSYCMLFKKNE
jgi:hypothetical protein